MKKIFKLFLILLMFYLNVFSQMQKGKTELRYLEQNMPRTIDPITVADATSIRITEILFGSLYTYNRFAEIIPEFALSEPIIQPDSVSYVIPIKPNLKFSDGTKLTIEDIIFSYNAAINPESDNLNRQIFSNISSLTKIDDLNLLVKFTHRVVDAKKYLMFFIIPKEAFLSTKIRKSLTYCREPIPTSGGYNLFFRSSANNQFIFDKNIHYSAKDNPKIEKIELNINPDLNGHVDNLRNGMVDLIPFVPPEQIPVVKRDSRFRLALYDANQYDFIGINFKNELLNFAAVRQALNIGFNREDILSSFFNNDGVLLSGPLPPSHFGFNPMVEPWPYDPQMANTLLDNLGIRDENNDGIREYKGNPVELRLLTTFGDATYNAIITSFIQQMKNIGIGIKLENYLPDIFEEKVIKGEFDLVYYNRKVTTDGDYSPFFMSTEAYAGGKNIGYYMNENIDKLFLQIKYTNDFQLKSILYQKIHEILKNECPYIFMWYLRYNAAYDRNLKNVRIDPFYFFTTIEEWFYE